MKIDFNNKKVLITGGSRGIGLQIAKEFKNCNADVYITQTQNRDIGFKYFKVDFLNEKETNGFLKEIQNIEFDILINNVGINRINNLNEYENQDWNDIMEVNLNSVFKTTKSVSKNMIKNNHGKIINITSISSYIGMPKRSAYCASKFGLVGFTKVISTELAEHNILVNGVGPGVTKTELTEKVLGQDKMNEFANKIPLGRLAETNEISPLVLFLCSDYNTYITGQNILIDGGYTNV